MSNPDRIAALIVKGYTKPLADDEEKELADWAAQSEENRVLLERLNDRQEVITHLKEYYSVMQEAGQWPGEQAIRVPGWRRAAALWCLAIIVLAGLGVAGYLYREAAKPRGQWAVVSLRRLTDDRQKDSLELPDHTKIWLNTSSFLYYPDTFTTDKREVILSGEAYFEVSTLPASPGEGKRPFIVKVLSRGDTVLVKVVGTHFNIQTSASGEQVITTVLRGRVNITRGMATTPLYAGEQVIADNSGLSRPLKVDTSITMAWKKDVFECNNVRINQIMNQLIRWYGIEVEYYGSVADHFSGVFEKKNGLAHNLTIMEKTSRVRFIRAGNKIVVKNIQ